MAVKNKIQDWSNLHRYKTANAKLAAELTNGQRIVFMGDSITEFWSTVAPDFFANNSYINRGISGQTSPQMLLRFRADVVALQPVAVIILGGINDIAGNTGPSTIEMIRDNIFSMAELATANNIKVILCSVLPASDFPWNPNQLPIPRIVELNVILKQYASEKEIEFIDYFSVMVDANQGLKREYSEDGVHPNKVGYEVMAALAEKAISNLIKKQ